MVRNKVRKKENRKQIDLAKSLSSTSRSTQGWEPMGFQAKVDWISASPGQKRTESEALLSNFIILPIFGPNRGSLWPIWRTRSQSKRETRLEERSGGSVFADFLFDRFVQTCDLFFLVWWRLWRPNFFPRRLSTTIAQRAFQHGLLATRISKRRDFLTCRSSLTGPSNFLATPSCPVMRTQTIIVKVVYCSLYAATELWSSFSVLGNLLRLVRNESSCSPWSFSAPSSEDLAWISNQVDPTRFFMIFHADHTCSLESRCSGNRVGKGFAGGSGGRVSTANTPWSWKHKRRNY